MRSKRIKDYSRYIVLMVYPWLLSSIYCIIRGTSLRGLYLPCAYNNDDLIYYKLVEGILKGNGKKPSSKPAKTVSAQQYEQRPYTEEELDNGDFAALLAEARAAR